MGATTVLAIAPAHAPAMTSFASVVERFDDAFGEIAGAALFDADVLSEDEPLSE